MAVDFLSLSNPINNRKIREVIMVGSDNITVYEPSIEDIRAMTEFQERKLEEANNVDSIDISGAEMVQFFFPLLTDIKGIEDLTEDEIKKVIDEPKSALLQVEQVITAIITEVYKTMILSAKTKVLELDFATEGAKAESQLLDSAFSHAAKEMGLEKLLNKVDNADKELQDAIAKSASRQEDIHQEIKREMGESNSGKIVVLPTKNPTKEEVIEELEETNMHLKAQNLYEKYKEEFQTGATPFEHSTK